MTYMKYKGYLGSIEPILETGSLYGKIVFIRDLVSYEAETLSELENEFRLSVDEYLTDCERLNREPDKPFKGSFNVRTSPELHRAAALAAQDSSLNAFVCAAIEEKLERMKIPV